MSESNLATEILKEMLDIFETLLKRIKENEKILIFESDKIIELTKMKEKFKSINIISEIKPTFETNTLYIYFIIKIYQFYSNCNLIEFNSEYSILYFKKIISYLQLLVKTNINIVEDELIKIFFYLLFIFFEGSNNINLDEIFFKGTFIELEERYSSKVYFEEPEFIRKIINTKKEKMKKKLIFLINYIFETVKEIIEINGKKKDKLIDQMYVDASNILFSLQKQNISEIIEKVKNFYKQNLYIIFTNYISETERSDLQNDIDTHFLEKIEKDYSPLKLNYSPFFLFSKQKTENEEKILSNQKIEEYNNQRQKYFQRMKYSILNEICKFDLENEINIFSLNEYKIVENFENIIKFKNGVENLEQKDIVKMIKDILYGDDFYEYYFSILKSEIISNFFNSHLCVDSNKKEFQIFKEKSNNSEYFGDIYSKFLEDYDKKNDGYKNFKNLIIIKILSIGDRVYTTRFLKKIIINPAQFLIGKDIKKDMDIKLILKGYLMVILLHEIDHFFRLLDKNNKVFQRTPREMKGGKMFMKYLFGVQSINHINKEHANEIFNLDNWKYHDKIKKIFTEQFEDSEEENITEFILNNYRNSISFYTIKKNEKKNNFSKNPHIKK